MRWDVGVEAGATVVAEMSASKWSVARVALTLRPLHNPWPRTDTTTWNGCKGRLSWALFMARPVAERGCQRVCVTWLNFSSAECAANSSFGSSAWTWIRLVALRRFRPFAATGGPILSVNPFAHVCGTRFFGMAEGANNIR